MPFLQPTDLTDAIIADPILYALVKATAPSIGSDDATIPFYESILSFPYPANVYCANLCMLTNTALGSYNLRTSFNVILATTGLPLTSRSGNYYRNKGIPGAFSKLDDQQLTDLLTPALKSWERSNRLDAKFDASKKVLSMDGFSYEIFRHYLESLPKGLTGKDAIKYVRDVTPRYNTPAPEKEIRYKYIKLIWDNSRHTLALAKVIPNFDSDFIHLAPFITLGAYNNYPTLPEHVTVDLDSLKSVASIYNVSTSSLLQNTNNSEAYAHNTAFPKPSPMNETDTALAVDYITILGVAAGHNTTLAPCYLKLINHISAELGTSSIDLTPHITKLQDQATTLQTTITRLKDIHEQINSNNPEV